MNIKIGDIIELENGQKVQLSMYNHWILDQYYDEELKCITDNRYDIKAVYRPVYEKIFEKGNNLSK